VDVEDVDNADPGAIERFRREARIGFQQPYHPHIIQLLDYGEMDYPDANALRMFLVMPLMDDGSLQDLIKWARTQDADLLPDVALDVLLGVARALDAAHGRRIIHRDVKPGNILLYHDDGMLHALLSDFGVAHLKEASRMTWSAQPGTVEFMAPELFDPDPQVEGTVDQYALAVTVYMALTGRLPFEAPNRHALPKMHVNDPPPPISRLRGDLPSALDGVLMKGLVQAPRRALPHLRRAHRRLPRSHWRRCGRAFASARTACGLPGVRSRLEVGAAVVDGADRAPAGCGRWRWWRQAQPPAASGAGCALDPGARRRGRCLRGARVRWQR
jgi:serine/threonine protein kinase